MTKYLIGSALGVAFFASAGTALANVDIDFLVVDGAPNTTVEKGDTVRAQVTFDTDGEDVESFSWRLVGSDMPPVCVNTVDATNPDGGTFVRSFDIKLGNNPEGTWDTELKSFGDNGGGSSNLCESMDENDDATFDDRITIVDNIDDNQDDDNDNNDSDGDNFGGNQGDNNGSSVSEFDKIMKAIQALVALITLQNSTPTTPAPTGKPAHCATYAAASMSGTFGLQSWLVANNYMTQTAMNTGPGIFGPRTSASNNAAATVCNK